jgi:glutathione S-transferase
MATLLATLDTKLGGWAKFQMFGLADILGSKRFFFGDEPVMVDLFLCDFLERWLAMDTELETKT